ncbi:MAG: rSAM/selenodomain-associated transferase 2 [Flavobacterium sp.]|jgi:rSAM/selenodomain-associated transferase 2
MMKPSISFSIIVPLLNEEGNIEQLIQSLSAIIAHENAESNEDKSTIEIIMVDGGSLDTTVALLNKLESCQIISTEVGRAKQMNEGAKKAKNDVLVFLHADTILPVNALSLLRDNFWLSDKKWGRFDVYIKGEHLLFRVIEYMINQRSKLSGICTGDQAIFVKKQTFDDLSGYASIPLMEDIDLSKRLKKFSSPYCFREKVITSNRRWAQRGIIRTILSMWQLRFLFFIGVSPNKLHKKYYG